MPRLVFNTDWWFYIPGYVEDANGKYYDNLYDEITDVCHKLYSKMERRSCIFSSKGKISYGMPGCDWEMSPTINSLKMMIENEFHERFDYCLAHIYPDGLASIAWHNDSEASMSPVLSISFGAARIFRFRDLGSKRGWRYALRLYNGDLVYMKTGCQYVLEHQVPVEKRITRGRINLTFRKLNADARTRIPKLQLEAAVVNRDKVIYTIGHSNRELDVFLKIIFSAKGIKNVVDVRTLPYSKNWAWFNREALQSKLSRETLLKYHHVPKLGGKKGTVMEKSPNKSIDILGFRNYADYTLTDAFEEGYNELLEITTTGTTVYFCAEAKYWQCHRRILSDMLTHRGWTVIHLGVVSGKDAPIHVVWPVARGEGIKLIYDQ